MQIIQKKDLNEFEKQEIIRIWNFEYPKSLYHPNIESFDRYLDKLGSPRHYLLTDDGANLKGWLMTFTREESLWFAMIVDSSEQKKGYGSMLLDEAKKSECELNGWAMDKNNAMKADGEIYLSPISFYLKNGFQVLDDIRLETETMSAVKIRWKEVG